MENTPCNQMSDSSSHNNSNQVSQQTRQVQNQQQSNKLYGGIQVRMEQQTPLSGNSSNGQDEYNLNSAGEDIIDQVEVANPKPLPRSHYLKDSDKLFEIEQANQNAEGIPIFYLGSDIINSSSKDSSFARRDLDASNTLLQNQAMVYTNFQRPQELQHLVQTKARPGTAKTRPQQQFQFNAKPIFKSNKPHTGSAEKYQKIVMQNAAPGFKAYGANKVYPKVRPHSAKRQSVFNRMKINPYAIQSTETVAQKRQSSKPKQKIDRLHAELMATYGEKSSLSPNKSFKDVVLSPNSNMQYQILKENLSQGGGGGGTLNPKTDGSQIFNLQQSPYLQAFQVTEQIKDQTSLSKNSQIENSQAHIKGSSLVIQHPQRKLKVKQRLQSPTSFQQQAMIPASQGGDPNNFFGSMRSYQDANQLRHMTGRLQARVQFLEGQIQIKDQLFQDMYRAAFQQLNILGPNGVTSTSQSSPNGQQPYNERPKRISNLEQQQKVNDLKRKNQNLKAILRSKEQALHLLQQNGISNDRLEQVKKEVQSRKKQLKVLKSQQKREIEIEREKILAETEAKDMLIESLNSEIEMLKKGKEKERKQTEGYTRDQQQKHMSSKDAEIEELSGKLRQMEINSQNSIEELENACQVLKLQVKELEQKMADQKTMYDQKISQQIENGKQNENQAAQIKELAEQRAQFELKSQELKTQIETLQAQVNDFEKLKEDSHNQISKLTQSYQETLKQSQLLETQVQKKDEEIQNAEEQKKIVFRKYHNIQSQVETLEHENQDLKKELEQARQGEVHGQLHDEQLELRSQIQELQTKLDSKETELNQKTTQFQELEEENKVLKAQMTGTASDSQVQNQQDDQKYLELKEQYEKSQIDFEQKQKIFENHVMQMKMIWQKMQTQAVTQRHENSELEFQLQEVKQILEQKETEIKGLKFENLKLKNELQSLKVNYDRIPCGNDKGQTQESKKDLIKQEQPLKDPLKIDLLKAQQVNKVEKDPMRSPKILLNGSTLEFKDDDERLKLIQNQQLIYLDLPQHDSNPIDSEEENELLQTISQLFEEGKCRLKYFCQVNRLKLDAVYSSIMSEKAEIGKNTTLGQVRNALEQRLCLNQPGLAASFAWHIFNKTSDTFAQKYKSFKNRKFVRLDEQIKCISVASSLEQMLAGVEHFSEQKESLMKLIIGKKLSESKNQFQLIFSSDFFRYSDFCARLREKDLELDEKTYECAFVYLLRNSDYGKDCERKYSEVKVSELVKYFRQWKNEANHKNEESMRLTGKAFDFPLEEDLTYSQDSEDLEEVKDQEVESEDKTYFPSSNLTETQLNKSGEQVPKRNSIEWVQMCQKSNDNTHKQLNTTALSDQQEAYQKRSTLSKKLDAFLPENASESFKQKFGELRNQRAGSHEVEIDDNTPMNGTAEQTLQDMQIEVKLESEAIRVEGAVDGDTGGFTTTKKENFTDGQNFHQARDHLITRNDLNYKLDTESHSDGDFCANDDRSDDDDNEVQEQIIEDVEKDQGGGMDYLSPESQRSSTHNKFFVEDSINDRDVLGDTFKGYDPVSNTVHKQPTLKQEQIQEQPLNGIRVKKLSDNSVNNEYEPNVAKVEDEIQDEVEDNYSEDVVEEEDYTF